jgi:hypothetical protein
MRIRPAIDFDLLNTGLLITSAVLVYLFIAPAWPLHRTITRTKASEIERVQ